MPRKSRVLRAANWVRVKPDGVHELVVSSDKDRYKTCHATPMILVDGPRRGRGGVATFHLQSVKFSTILRGCGCANPAELFPSSPTTPPWPTLLIERLAETDVGILGLRKLIRCRFLMELN
jgi:hypothetical protein